MKKVYKRKNTSNLADYVYIRLGHETKERVKTLAVESGSNMTLWIRQLIVREVNRLSK